ncbi:AraC family transcriptional regulator [uncultured Algoriphagus sp.]|uniref:AraC family transcriptional regulator n=1 Tax=uncultured Algoriphagus sp. TaxID=417365 RepID=UPI0030EDAA3B|tara:strand:- start:55113 stop:55913 length:801 start_codon:yes stop_codon:yes gene_type:complete
MRAITGDSSVNILKEQFIPDHVFIYVAKGGFRVFDGNKSYTFKAGDACFARKNRLAKYELLDSIDGFEPIIFCFDELFLQKFLKKDQFEQTHFLSKDAFIHIQESTLVESFIQSIKPYYKGVMQIDELFEEVKYEELLLILLKIQPELAGILFDFRKPGKIDLEEFMNRNFKFNVSISRFAYLTGRSLSAFKRDFKTIFDDTPSHWLMQMRLREAYLLLNKKNQKPSDFYLDLGFESLSHFSTSFKKMYGHAPTKNLGKNTHSYII